MSSVATRSACAYSGRVSDVLTHFEQAIHLSPTDPWRWALIHGGFVLAACSAHVLFWKQTEHEQRGARVRLGGADITFVATEDAPLADAELVFSALPHGASAVWCATAATTWRPSRCSGTWRA